MPKNAVPWFITILAVVAGVLGYRMFVPSERARYEAVRKVRNASSDIHMRMTVTYDHGKIDSEEYRMEDLNGRSTASYRITGSSGKTYTITSPPVESHTVPFFFEELVQDGIWKITNQPPRGDTNAHYTLEVRQEVQNERGSRTITFTDPHYLATTAGRQYQLHLDKNKPVPDLLKMSSTALADPRYQKLVDDFRQFGVPSFRQKVADAQNHIRQGR